MDNLKKTPLYEAHLALNGKIIDFGGWALPVQYSSVIAEHMAVREHVGIFDVSHMGEIDVSGADAFSYIQNLVTNDITTMTPGRCRYSPVCYPDGGTVDDILIYKLADDHYLLVVNAANTEKDFNWFEKNRTGDVKIENQSDEWAQIALQGPCFMDVLRSVGVSGTIPEKNYTFNEDVTVAGLKCLMSRTGYTGEDGVEIYCKAKDGMVIYEALIAAGTPFGLLPCGLGARDTLRFEASMPLYGHEITASISPREAGLNFAIKMKKESFIGKDALAQDQKRVRIGLKLIDKGIAREHTDLYVGDRLVGQVTSGGPAPALKGNYAMALVNIEDAEAEFYEIDIRGRRVKASKVALPFYKRA
ncbi:MAG: glycine cleavage system aminomethyltransferase GcvT [Clostridia bacterium]